MENKQLMQTVTKELTVKSEGKSRTEAFEKALGLMRKQVYKEVNGLVMKMEPLEVYLLEEEVDTKTEHFLFIFMPRKKSNYTVTYKFKIEFSYIENLDKQ